MVNICCLCVEQWRSTSRAATTEAERTLLAPRKCRVATRWDKSCGKFHRNYLRSMLNSYENIGMQTNRIVSMTKTVLYWYVLPVFHGGTGKA